MKEKCPFCASPRDMIPSPWGNKLICDKPACTYLRTLQRLRDDSERPPATAGRHTPPLAIEPARP
jgi:hypothetical protein